MSRDSSRRRIWVVGLALAVALVPALAFAAHPEGDFEDVPDDHTFHDDIQWMHDNGITRGCNPPENDEYCPDRELIRAEEAAFFHRYDNFLRNSLEDRLVPEECEESQIAEYNSESDSWQCADRTDVSAGIGDLSVSPGEGVNVDPGDTDASVIATCDEGQVALTGFLVPANGELTYDAPSVSDGQVDFTVALDAAAMDTVNVTAYAICTTA